jgi:hypothetical protein
MFLTDLCSEIVGNIVVFLDPKTVLRASQSSNAMAKLLKKHSLSVRCTESAQAKALGLFYSKEGALFGCAHVLKITAIARNPCRVVALKNWIKSQVVCIDADGFFVKQQYNMNFGSDGLERVRIKLWDKPLSYSRTYGRNGNDYIFTLYLQADFFPLMYNP